MWSGNHAILDHVGMCCSLVIGVLWLVFLAGYVPCAVGLALRHFAVFHNLVTLAAQSSVRAAPCHARAAPCCALLVSRVLFA